MSLLFFPGQTIDTRSRQILPPIGVAPSPVPQLNYRRTKKAATHFADLRSDLLEKSIIRKKSIADSSPAKVDSSAAVDDVRLQRPQRTLSRASSAQSRQSDGNIVKTLLAEAG